MCVGVYGCILSFILHLILLILFCIAGRHRVDHPELVERGDALDTVRREQDETPHLVFEGGGGGGWGN